MKKNVLHAFAMNLGYAQMLAKDVTPEEMTQQPSGIPNHAAWTLGHMVLAADGAAKYMGQGSTIPENYGELFGKGSTPTAAASHYPDKETLLSQLAEQHERAAAAFESVSDNVMTKPLEDENLRSAFPTNGDLIVFLLTGHGAIHNGQFSAWRRALGKPTAIPGM